MLAGISAHVSQFVKRKFDLTFPPDPGSLTVSIDGRLLDSGFVVDGTSIELQMNPSRDAKTIAMSYTYGGGVVTDYIDLKEDVDPRTLDLRINGEAVTPDQYRIIEGKTIVFNTAPPQNAVMKADYRKNEPLDTAFSLQWPSLASVEGVFVNKKKVARNKYELNQADGKLIFREPPLDGSEIALRYKEEDAKTLRYNMPSYEDREIASVEILDPTSGEIISGIEKVGTELVFPPEEIWNGRQIVLRVHLQATEDDFNFNFSIPETALPESITAKTLQGEDCSNGISLDQSWLNISCELSVSQGLTVDYTYVVGFTNIFVVEEESREENLWRVKINGREIHDYQRQGGVLTISEGLLNPGDTVLVEIYPPVFALNTAD